LRLDVERHILDMIRAGELRAGDRVNEVHVASDLGISRTPVREALARLIRDGLLVHWPRRGVYVAELSRETVEEIAQIRSLLETFAARLAAQRRQPADITRLRQIIAEGISAGRGDDWVTFEEKNAEFHNLIIGVARHAVLSRVWGMLSPQTWKLTPGSWPDDPDESAVHDFVTRHEALLDAIAAADPDAAAALAETHVRKAADVQIERRFGSPHTQHW
jgi:DNA-binding GntR family transcriptional regulator